MHRKCTFHCTAARVREYGSQGHSASQRLSLDRHYSPSRTLIGNRELVSVLHARAIELKRGDTLVLRAGFAEAFVRTGGQLNPTRLHSYGAVLDDTDKGLLQGITNSRIAALRADDYAVEAALQQHETVPHTFMLTARRLGYRMRSVSRLFLSRQFKQQVFINYLRTASIDMGVERVLITGGASGIGAACARRCAEEGYEVVVIDRVGDGLIADLSDPDQTTQALETALRRGPITRLVNNVGMVRPAAVEEQTLDDFDAVMALNARCAMQCMQALLPGMKAAGFGRIVNMASRTVLGKELRTAYAASKAALIGMTRVWALELGMYGITANAVGPGPIRTELFDRANPPGSARTEAIVNAIPVRSIGTPDDVAHGVTFFLDRRASFITGQTLYVCGGMTVGAGGM